MARTKRDLLLSLVDSGAGPEQIPAAFFLHFDAACHRGRAAVNKHLEYFRATGMDIVKIQYEHRLPAMPDLASPRDWARVPLYREAFFRDPLDVVAALVAEAKKEALVVVTLYSPFMFAGHISGAETLVRHLEEEPEQVKKGMEVVTESVLAFVRGCVKRGVDGFYASTQGAEVGRFSRPDVFERYVKPFDLAVWDVLKNACPFNILHVCDYHGLYDGLERFRDYPGQIVNAGLKLSSRTLTPRDVAGIFGRPFMGGMDRHGVISRGPIDAVRAEAESVLAQAPERFMLAADCTVPSETPWENLTAAIDAAHTYRKG